MVHKLDITSFSLGDKPASTFEGFVCCMLCLVDSRCAAPSLSSIVPVGAQATYEVHTSILICLLTWQPCGPSFIPASSSNDQSGLAIDFFVVYSVQYVVVRTYEKQLRAHLFLATTIIRRKS
jgi:hypothetical protein